MAVNNININLNGFPSFFKIIIESKGYLNKLGIPVKFMAEYGTDLLDVITLETPTGMTWEVKLDQENGKAWFGDGWLEFVEYHSLCHGHFLMFTYAKMSLFKVCIFDWTACEIEYPLDIQKKVIGECMTKANSSSPNACAEEKGMVALVSRYRREFGTLTNHDIQKINAHQFENPSFSVIMPRSYVNDRFRMSIPSKFASTYMNNFQGGSLTLQTSTSDTWPVKCSSCNRVKYKEFAAGWKEFAVDNNLRVGDVCVFELVEAAEQLFKVEIIRCFPEVDVGVAT